MKIYTKRGDQGQTSLYGGESVDKDHLRLQVYGTIDELNSHLGFAMAVGLREVLPKLQGEKQMLLGGLLMEFREIQAELFQLGAELATPADKKISMSLVDDEAIERLEKEIDRVEAFLSPLKSFVLPGGSEFSASLHCVRTVVRRTEREAVTLSKSVTLRPEVICYLNRLSDACFVWARFANYLNSVEDVPWVAPKN